MLPTLFSVVSFAFIITTLIPPSHTDPVPSVGHNRITRSLFHRSLSYDKDEGGLFLSIPRLVRRQLPSETVARNYISSKLGLPSSPSDLKLQNLYTDEHNGLTYLYFMQIVQNTEVVNGLASVIVDRNNNVVAFHDSLASNSAISSLAARKSLLDPKEAVKTMANYLRSELKWTINDLDSMSLSSTMDNTDQQVVWVKGAEFSTDKIWTKPRLMVIGNDNNAEYEGSYDTLKWVVDVRAKTDHNWLNFQVSNAGDDKVIGVADWTSEALYRVFPSVGFQSSPDEGKLVLVQDPEDTQRGSPRGWSQDSATSGNNVFARESINGGIRTDPLARGSIDPQLKKLTFNFFTDPSSGDPKSGLDASITNAFYATNLMHDILYVYGFTESNGNFQRDNFGRGGVGNDNVIVNVQDNTSRNNANFRTPPDGQQPELTAFLFDLSGTVTDGALSNDILFHEYTHGMVGRLTGGSSNPNCLAGREAGGMNEGWADMVAVLLKQRAGANRGTNVAIASFNTGKPSGIRRFPYSTSTDTNPLTYGDLPKQTIVHQIGEIWAAMLFEAYWNMVDKHGYNPEWRQSPSVVPKGTKLSGNILFMQLLVDGLKLQPCNPTFVQARDAILLADRTNNNGENQCELWSGFAKRGLGVRAAPGGKEDFGLPKECTNGRRQVRF